MIHEEYNKVLVVDDDSSVRDSLEEFLTNKGYEVKTAADGQLAVSAVKNERFDIIVLDLMMPGLNGMEAFNSIKEIDPEPVVIIMTGFASLDSAIQAIRHGAYDYLTKPFQLDEFLVAVENASEKVFLREQHKVFVDELRRAYLQSGGEGGSRKTATSDGEPSEESSTAIEPLNALERLSDLFERGMLSREEFEILKKRFIPGG
ncbi:MAG: response regulator [Thermodesulfobacteriota bacterium]